MNETFERPDDALLQDATEARHQQVEALKVRLLAEPVDSILWDYVEDLVAEFDDAQVIKRMMQAQ